MRSALLLLAAGVAAVDALRVEVKLGTERCLGEEISSSVLAVGNYAVMGLNTDANELSGVDVTVKDTQGEFLYRKENADSGKFAFTASESGKYLVCLKSSAATRRVQLSLRTGVEARDYSEVAKKENL